MNYYPGTSQLGLAQLGAMWLGYAPPPVAYAYRLDGAVAQAHVEASVTQTGISAEVVQVREEIR